MSSGCSWREPSPLPPGRVAHTSDTQTRPYERPALSRAWHSQPAAEGAETSCRGSRHVHAIGSGTSGGGEVDSSLPRNLTSRRRSDGSPRSLDALPHRSNTSVNAGEAGLRPLRLRPSRRESSKSYPDVATDRAEKGKSRSERSRHRQETSLAPSKIAENGTSSGCNVTKRPYSRVQPGDVPRTPGPVAARARHAAT